MKITINSVLDWMQHLEPDGIFDELKDRMLKREDAEVLETILLRWEQKANTKPFMHICRKMRHAVTIQKLASGGVLIFDMGKAIQYALDEKIPVIITDGTVSRQIISCEYESSKYGIEESLHMEYELDGKLRSTYFTGNASDYVLSFYCDHDNPDGYLMLEPEWYANIG